MKWARGSCIARDVRHLMKACATITHPPDPRSATESFIMAVMGKTLAFAFMLPLHLPITLVYSPRLDTASD